MANNGSESGNYASTSNDTLTATWAPLPVFILSISCTSGVLNTLFLLMFAFHWKLYTPFNVYLINLMFSNVLYAVLEMPMEITDDLYPSWWLGERCCTLYMYSNWAISLSQENIHVMIALNRFWALVYPISYRRTHRLWTAWLLCYVAWAIAHVVAVPMVVLNEQFFETNLAVNGCRIYTESSPLQVAWQNTNQFFCCAGVVVVMAVLPFALYNRAHRMRASKNAVDPSRSTKASLEKDHFTKASMVPMHGSSVHTTNSGHGHGGRGNGHSKSGHHGLLLLTLLTVAVAICWIPEQTVYTLIPFFDIPTIAVSTVSCLYDLQAVIDPVLFVLAVKDVREVFFACFRRRSL